jgi:O-antigen/teichoic acid export membrane protein
VLNLLIAFGGSLVLARLLTPDDFGIVAVGSTVVVLATAVAEGGLGSGLIRREAPPTHGELRTLLGLQLLVTSLIAAVVASIVGGLGTTGAVVALMTLTLPIAAVQTPARVVLTRDVRLNRVAAADLAGLTASYAWSIPTVLLGAGVWGMASGTIVRALTASTLLTMLSPQRFLVPSLRGVRKFGPVARFGITFQAGWLVTVVRDQILNLALALLAGVGALGQWSLARRMLDGPIVPFDAIHRVTFPALTHVLSLKIDPRPLVVKIARRSAVASSLLLVPLAVSAQAIVTVLFGEQWAEAAKPFSLACVALMIGGPIAAATFGYLGASGRPGVMLRMITVSAVAGICVSLLLLPRLGATAIGIGWLVQNVIGSFIVSRAMVQTLGVKVLRSVADVYLVSVPIAMVGWAAVQLTTPTTAEVLAAGAVCLSAVLVGLLVVCRSDVFETFRTVIRSLQDAVGIGSAEGVDTRVATGTNS